MTPPLFDRSASSWFLQGMRAMVSLPAMILLVSQIGFSVLAFEAGLTRTEAVFMTLAVWALPAQVILIGSMLGGANLAACFLAVTLSSIRLTPMVASIVPQMRMRGTPTWLMLFLSHFIAITAWVFAMTSFDKVPREHRAVYFAGFGMTLTSSGALLVGIFHGLVAAFPPLVAGALFFLTPVYFTASVWASAQQPVVRLAFIAGVVLGPLLTLVSPQFDVLYAGLGGGSAAYLIDRWRRRGGANFWGRG